MATRAKELSDLGNLKLDVTANGIDVVGVGSNFKSESYNVLNLQTDTDDSGSSDDGIFKITNGAAGTTKAEFRWDESEDLVHVSYGDHGRHISINSDGDVGIGTGSTDPVYKLDVTGGGRFTTDLRIGSENLRLSTDGSGELGLGYGSTHSTANRIRVYQNTTPVFSVRDDGAIDTAQVRHSVRPTLNLDFANSKELDPRITFYRDSIATYYDSKGTLRYANMNEPRFDHDPVTGESKGLLIEEARAFLNVNTVTAVQPNNNFWGQTNATISVKQAVAPDGTFSADGVHANSVNDGHGLFRSFVPAANTHYTLTGYYKRGANRYVSHAWYYNEAAGNSNFPTAFYDLDNGTFTHTSGINRGTTMTDVGNGWYRCSLTVLSDNTPGTSSYFYATSASSASSGAYVGTGAIDSYFWGLQIETGPFPTSFMPSDTAFNLRSSIATYYDKDGVLRTAPVDGARYGYTSPYATEHWGLVSTVKTRIGSTEPETTPVETGLILEPAATNLEDHSYNMSSSNHGVALSTGASFVVTGDLTAPDGSYTASKFTFAGTSDRLDDVHGTFTDGDTYTFSMWVKGVAGQVVGMALLNNLGGNVEPYIYLTGDWQRISITKTFDSQGTNIRTHGVIIRGNPGGYAMSNQGDAGTWATHVYVWGMQIEEGFSSTSYIPTYGGTATRSADVDTSLDNGESYTRKDDAVFIDNLQYSDWYNREEGTYYLDFDSNATEDTEVIVLGQPGYPWILYKYLANQWKTYNGNNSIVTPMSSTINPSKGAISFGKTSGSTAQNGNAGLTNDVNLTQGVELSNMSTLDIGYGRNANANTFNGTIKKISYYPTEMTSAELQALTENN